MRMRFPRWLEAAIRDVAKMRAEARDRPLIPAYVRLADFEIVPTGAQLALNAETSNRAFNGSNDVNFREGKSNSHARIKLKRFQREQQGGNSIDLANSEEQSPSRTEQQQEQSFNDHANSQFRSLSDTEQQQRVQHQDNAQSSSSMCPPWIGEDDPYEEPWIPQFDSDEEQIENPFKTFPKPRADSEFEEEAGYHISDETLLDIYLDRASPGLRGGSGRFSRSSNLDSRETEQDPSRENREVSSGSKVGPGADKEHGDGNYRRTNSGRPEFGLDDPDLEKFLEGRPFSE